MKTFFVHFIYLPEVAEALYNGQQHVTVPIPYPYDTIDRCMARFDDADRHWWQKCADAEAVWIADEKEIPCKVWKSRYY